MTCDTNKEMDLQSDVYRKLVAVMKKRLNQTAKNSTSSHEECQRSPSCKTLLELAENNSSYMEMENFSDLFDLAPSESWWKVIIVIFYSAVILVSLVGNSLVIRLIYKHRKIHLTIVNVFICNMAISDLLMTMLNIPFSLIRVSLHNWPFGTFICTAVPLVQVTSVYVSTITMTCIALDRHQAIISPLKQRFFKRKRKVNSFIILFIWIIALSFSLPHGTYNRVTEEITYRKMIRCTSEYPSQSFRKWLTLFTFLTQYVIPLTLTTVCYSRLVTKIRYRAVLGAATENQLRSRLRSKRRTIVMLIIVVVVFAICWLPLNVYHLISDFGSVNGASYNRSYVFFPCHILAMSSVCYNPFIYCWLNEQFNRGAKQLHRWILSPCIKSYRHQKAVLITMPSVSSMRRNSVSVKMTAYLKNDRNSSDASAEVVRTIVDNSNSNRARSQNDCKISKHISASMESSM